ncbi:MAG: hypothetical protein V2A65_08965 [Candidatus Omnitrophota bacterium]
MLKGQLKLQKLMDVGTSNPIVAGLTIGLHNIVEMAQIDHDAKNTINTANLNIAQSLTKAEKIGLQVCKNIEAVMKDLNETGVQTQSSGCCVNLPSTDGLDDVREVLKYGKQALQELVKIINLFCDTGCTNPNYKKICDKLGAVYGESDSVFLQVKQDHDGWLKKFLDLRDADEHPNCIPKGKKLYYDFDITWSEPHQKWVVDAPHFYEGTFVYEMIKTSIHNIFTFAEEINILFLQKHMLEMVQICKVPEGQQAGWGGRRFVIQPKPPFYPKDTKPEGKI